MQTNIDCTFVFLSQNFALLSIAPTHWFQCNGMAVLPVLDSGLHFLNCHSYFFIGFRFNSIITSICVVLLLKHQELISSIWEWFQYLNLAWYVSGFYFNLTLFESVLLLLINIFLLLFNFWWDGHFCNNRGMPYWLCWTKHFSHSRYLKGLIIAIICVSKWRVIWLAGRLGHGGRGT